MEKKKETKAWTGDPMAQVLACLSCTMPRCINCVESRKAWEYYQTKRAEKKTVPNV